jgi:hypothetical protein
MAFCSSGLDSESCSAASPSIYNVLKCNPEGVPFLGAYWLSWCLRTSAARHNERARQLNHAWSSHQKAQNPTPCSAADPAVSFAHTPQCRAVGWPSPKKHRTSPPAYPNALYASPIRIISRTCCSLFTAAARTVFAFRKVPARLKWWFEVVVIIWMSSLFPATIIHLPRYNTRSMLRGRCWKRPLLYAIAWLIKYRNQFDTGHWYLNWTISPLFESLAASSLSTKASNSLILEQPLATFRTTSSAWVRAVSPKAPDPAAETIFAQYLGGGSESWWPKWENVRPSENEEVDARYSANRVGGRIRCSLRSQPMIIGLERPWPRLTTSEDSSTNSYSCLDNMNRI